MHEGTSEPLSPQDREEILIDIEDLEVFQTLLQPRGVRGLLVECAECEEQHFFEWELLRSNLRHLLDVGSIRVHEPAYRPDPADYVTWDYAQGFADGVMDAAEADGVMESAEADGVMESAEADGADDPDADPGPTIDLR